MSHVQAPPSKEGSEGLPEHGGAEEAMPSHRPWASGRVTSGAGLLGAAVPREMGRVRLRCGAVGGPDETRYAEAFWHTRRAQQGLWGSPPAFPRPRPDRHLNWPHCVSRANGNLLEGFSDFGSIFSHGDQGDGGATPWHTRPRSALPTGFPSEGEKWGEGQPDGGMGARASRG